MKLNVLKLFLQSGILGPNLQNISCRVLTSLGCSYKDAKERLDLAEVGCFVGVNRVRDQLR